MLSGNEEKNDLLKMIAKTPGAPRGANLHLSAKLVIFDVQHKKLFSSKVGKKVGQFKNWISKRLLQYF